MPAISPQESRSRATQGSVKWRFVHTRKAEQPVRNLRERPSTRNHPLFEVGEDTVNSPLGAYLHNVDWSSVEAALDEYGCAIIPRLLSPSQCRALASLYPDDARFRSRVVMTRHGFGKGEYKYFGYPLPELVASFREALYPHLAPIANRWMSALNIDIRYPATHAAFIRRCHAAGQRRPTPLLLRYGSGDYNCLHQDLYGEHVFPLQVAVLLSEPGRDFSGGEFVLTEQRPRMQSRVEVVRLGQGDAVVFAVSHRPVQGTRGAYRVNMRHGVSRLLSGERHTLGIIFHDAL
ncbi:proline hydroxylase [Trinickia symbiotica]|uniref:Proline hydroxylase n=1 Tax=Trinickia symbiotica TaxID=863227 RepID=A0A2N7WRX7_9BURK|nr:proline hydroxylase [Trinickia symbiotica]